jgi:hypothetical protein
MLLGQPHNSIFAGTGSDPPEFLAELVGHIESLKGPPCLKKLDAGKGVVGERSVSRKDEAHGGGCQEWGEGCYVFGLRGKPSSRLEKLGRKEKAKSLDPESLVGELEG